MIGLVLTGGQSSRMQTNKAFIEYDNTKQLIRCIGLLKEICSTVYVSCKKEQAKLYSPYASLVLDQYNFQSPLNGILSCLKQHKSPTLVMPIDMPLIAKEDLKTLMLSFQNTNAGVCFLDSDHKLPDPLLGIYSPELLSLHDKKEESLRRMIKTNIEKFKILPHPNANRQMNVNTPKEKETAETIMQTKYQPINCTFYDLLEAAATKRSINTIQYREKESTVKTTKASIITLYTSDKQEFIKLSNGITLRLDQLVQWNEHRIADFNNGDFTCKF